VFGLNEEDSFPPIYKFMAAKFSSPVRSAALRLFLKMSSYMIEFDESNKEMFVNHIHKISNSLFSSIADESSQVQRILWKSLLFSFCNRFGATVWEQIDIKKGVLPQLNTCLKNAGFGAHTDLYKHFVAFVSIFPIFQFEESLETVCKVGKAKPKVENTKSEEETVDTASKKKKKNKEGRGEGEKTIKNTFSVAEKINVMYELMRSLFSGLDVEEAIAFNEDIIGSYFDTMSYLYLKRIIPALEALKQKGDTKNYETLKKKSVQCLMLPITEYLKKNDPSLNNSLYKMVPVKFSETLTLLANKDVDVSHLEDLYTDLDESLMIGLERSPHNAIKILSGLLITVPHGNKYFDRTQSLGSEIIQNLYKVIQDGVQAMSKDTIDKLVKDVEIF